MTAWKAMTALSAFGLAFASPAMAEVGGSTNGRSATPSAASFRPASKDSSWNRYQDEFQRLRDEDLERSNGKGKGNGHGTGDGKGHEHGGGKGHCKYDERCHASPG